MKKYTLYFGEFKQFDKVFLTAEKGVDPASVTSVAFCGDALYIATAKGTFEYNNGNLKKLSFSADKFFSADGKLYGANGNSLYTIKNGNIIISCHFIGNLIYNTRRNHKLICYNYR